MVCKYCQNMFSGRCDNCGRIKLMSGGETNEFKTKEEQERDLRGGKRKWKNN